jgi:xylulokinase
VSVGAGSNVAGPGDVTIGVDLGTSGLKVVAFDVAGQVVGRARQGYPTSRPELGAAEQDTGDWLRAIVVCLQQLGNQIRPDRWRALGLSAMLPTLVALDSSHTPVGPAITWQDARADQEGDQFRASVGGEELYLRTGQWVDGRYLLPMMTGLSARRPDLAQVANSVAGAKDFVFCWLTGELLTDPSTAAGYGCFDLASGAWDRELGSRFPWSLPAVCAADTVRAISPRRAAEIGLPPDLPIVLGAADSVLGAYGLGVRSTGDIAYIAGTSTVILGRYDNLVPDPSQRYLITPLADVGASVDLGTAPALGAEMDLLATGSALAWLAELLCLAGGPAEVASLAAGADPMHAPVFLPYLAPGEQGALWDPELSGALVGMALSHGSADLARALQTGIVVESVRCLGVLAEVGAGPGPLRVGGAAGVGGPFAQDLADASGRAVLISPGEPDHSAVGAAMFAAQAVGLDQQARLPDTVLLHHDPSRKPQWEQLFQNHEVARVAQRTTRQEQR